MPENEMTPLGEVGVGDPRREKETDLLKRQIILIQDASDPRIFVARVEMFEAMLEEDIAKQKVEYDPEEIMNKIRATTGLKPAQMLTDGAHYSLAIEKFKFLYRIFKESHMPVSMEVRL